MCAVFGFIKRHKDAAISRKEITQMVKANQSRGPHAFGFAWVNKEGRIKAFRCPGEMTDFVSLVQNAASEAVAMIGHLRWSTHGDARDNINNHPHACDGGWIIHNGIIYDYESLYMKHDLLPSSDCDSEVLARLIEVCDGNLKERAAQTIETVGTEASVVMLGLWANPARLIVARRGNPLHVSRHNGVTFFSTVKNGAPGDVKEFPEDTLIEVNERGKDGKTYALSKMAAAKVVTGASFFADDDLDYVQWAEGTVSSKYKGG